jgi:MoaA/NifB/PqqE/SkfB family radical SAM enzyme
VQTKRGCSLTCEYCTYPALEGRRVRLRDPERVADELCELRALHQKIHHLFVVDSVFTIPKSHAMAVCGALGRRGWPVPWTCYANPIGFDDELATAMARAGCRGLEIGVDSGSDEILAALRKGFDTKAVVAMHEACRQAGLRACPSFLVGIPSEGADDVRRTLDFIDRLAPFAAVIMLYTDPREAVEPALRARGAARRASILELLEPYLASHPRWIVPATSLNFDARLFALLRRMGLHGPLWQHIDEADERWQRLSRLRDAFG